MITVYDLQLCIQAIRKVMGEPQNKINNSVYNSNAAANGHKFYAQSKAKNLEAIRKKTSNSVQSAAIIKNFKQILQLRSGNCLEYTMLLIVLIRLLDKDAAITKVDFAQNTFQAGDNHTCCFIGVHLVNYVADAWGNVLFDFDNPQNQLAHSAYYTNIHYATVDEIDLFPAADSPLLAKLHDTKDVDSKYVSSYTARLKELCNIIGVKS